jgi:N-acetylglucosamine-6-phosphate deacetylase
VSELIIKNGYVYNTPARRFFKGNIRISGGAIEAIDNICCCDCGAEVIDASGKYIIPGMVDVHTHGRANADFTDATVEQCLAMAKSYAEAGTTTVFATPASAPYPTMVESTKNAAAAAKKTRGIGASIDGVHIEGRYLSLEKRGAHDPKLLALPNNEELEGLTEAIGDIAKRITVAPELPGGEEFVRLAVKHGYSVSIGHSNTTYEQALEALSWGVNSFTHTFNAMRGLHHREPGTVGAALTCDNAFCEVIPDGFHLNPAMVRLIYLAKDKDHLCLITDSMMATGCSDGVYSIAGLPVYVKDGLAREEDGTISGSTLNLLDGVFRFMKFCGIGLEEAIPYATKNPAVMTGIYGHTGSIAAGKRADILILGEDRRTLEGVYAAGCKIK